MNRLHVSFPRRLCLSIKAASLILLSAFLLPGSAFSGGEEGKWRPLFDGKTLDGWMVKCRPADKDKCYWKVIDGTIAAEVPAGSKHHYIWLLTEKEYGDFELKAKIQSFAKVKGNSGIQVRSRYDDEEYWLDGPQVDIHPPGPWRCGFIYDETRETKKWLSPISGPPSKAKESDAPAGWNWKHADEGENVWNDVHIICRGTSIKTIINGITVCEYDGKGKLDDEDHRRHRVGLKGHIGLQIHPGGQLEIRFKDLMVKPADGRIH